MSQVDGVVKLTRDVEMICRCGRRYFARQADLDRGWARSCDKICAAKRRDFGGKAAKRADGKPLTMKTKRKGARRLTPDTRTYTSPEWQHERDVRYAEADASLGWDEHKFGG